MKIKTRLEISAIFFICMVIAVGLTLSYMTQQVNEVYTKHSVVNEIVERAFTLNMLTGDYLVHQEERIIAQWLHVHDSLSDHLAGLELKNHEEQLILDEIRQNHEETEEVFSRLVAIYEEQESSGEKSELRGITITQLSVKLTDIVSEASQLSEISQERYVRTQEFSSLLVLIFVVVIAASIGVNSFFIITTIGRPIADLHHGVEMIRSGILDHKVGILAKDEIGQLSRNFDEMTEELKTRTEKLKEYSENLEEMVEKRTKELRDAQEKLVRQEKLAVLGKLAGGVGHELRNPLGAIKNAAHFLNMAIETPDPEVKEILEIIEKEITTSERIISSLLDYARAKPITRREVDIKDVVHEALSLTAIPGNVETVIQIDKALPSILADPAQLRQVFGNIILNAIQGMPEGGQLIIKCETPSPEQMSISFTDTGTGIPKENLEKIWEPLFTTKARGIGLGLALCKTQVEGHGGVIEVESMLGEGATFTVKLPLQGE